MLSRTDAAQRFRNGDARTRKLEFRIEHSTQDMVEVASKKCAYEGCSTVPGFSVAGSRKPGLCAKHAMECMVDVKSKRRAHGG